MTKGKAIDLYDPRSGGQAIRLSDLQVGGKAFNPARTNYFTIYRIESGAGTFWADASQFAFGPSSLLFFVPYQHIRIVSDSPVQGDVIQFHANFLCVETFEARQGDCTGGGIQRRTLFQPPVQEGHWLFTHVLSGIRDRNPRRKQSGP